MSRKKNNTTLDIFHSLHPHGKAFDYQCEWVTDDSKFKIAAKARQIGITTSEAIHSFIKCLMWSENKDEPDPPVIVFCSPSARQSNRLMTYVQRARARFENVYKARVKFRKEREDWLHFDNGAEIWSLPNNPRTIEGIDASRGVIDEFGNFLGKEDREVYESLMGSLGAKGGGITVFGKPRGRRGLFWELYDPHGEFAKNFSRHEFSWGVRSKHDKRYKKTVEEQRSRMTSLSFQEQYECAFIDEGIVVFPWALLDQQTKDFRMWTDTTIPDTKDPCYMGIDFGKKTSQTVVSVVTHGEKTRLRYHKATSKSFDEQLQWIEMLIHRFQPMKVLVDKTGLGVPLEEKLIIKFSNRVEGIQFSNATKEKLVLTTYNLLDSRQLEIPDIYELKEQMHGIEKEITDKGNIRYTGKRTETDWKDDRFWSLALSCCQLGSGDWSFSVADNLEVKPMSSYDKFRFGIGEDED